MNNRFSQLDSLRGLAALTVFLGHVYGAFNETVLAKFMFRYGILRGFIASGEAVILFFILSGFVLALPFSNGKQITYQAYLIKRFFRIYIPYIVAVALAAMLMKLFYSGRIDNLTAWFNTLWDGQVNTEVILEHILFLPIFKSSINSVVWSLVHEMRISLIFPLIMFVVMKIDWRRGLYLAVGASVLSVVYSVLYSAPFKGAEWYCSLHYSAMFIIGATAAKYRIILLDKAAKLSSKNKLIIFGFGVLMYVYVRPSYLVERITHLSSYSKMVVDSWFITVGACILIVLSLASFRFGKMLQVNFIKFLGKVSYSLYLIHLPILLTLMHSLNQIMPTWAICIIAIPTVITTSHFMYKYVEAPAMEMGRRLVSHIDSKKIILESKNVRL